MSTAPSRAHAIADAAIRVLAARGMRGLTHRAVDEAAGLPPGSTSNRARTRAALLELAVRRAAERDAEAVAAGGAPPGPAEGTGALAEAIAELLHRFVTRHRELLLARYELALEATRRPELRAVYDEASRLFRGPVGAFLAAAGSPAPERHTRSLIAWMDGVLFSSAAGGYHAEPPAREELAADLRELLGAMIPRGV